MENKFVRLLHSKLHSRKELNTMVKDDLGCGAPNLRAVACDTLIAGCNRNRYQFSFPERARSEKNILLLQAIGDYARRTEKFENSSIGYANQVVAERFKEYGD